MLSGYPCRRRNAIVQPDLLRRSRCKHNKLASLEVTGVKCIATRVAKNCNSTPVIGQKSQKVENEEKSNFVISLPDYF